MTKTSPSSNRQPDPCKPDARKYGTPAAHTIGSNDDDLELQLVYSWLGNRSTMDLFRTAADSAVKYVLDGARTWRFNLMDPSVDKDERASVGTKLQYHVIQQLGLTKEPPLDTTIVGVSVEIKGTVRNNWMIPKEGQCEITLLIEIDASANRFAVWLIRSHRLWLTGGNGNGDRKRSFLVDPLREFRLPVVPWTALPDEPLRLLNYEQLLIVFGKSGLKNRLIALFSFLPEIVIPRGSIQVVGAGLGDPMKRAREAKVDLWHKHGLATLVGTWSDQRKMAEILGFVLDEEEWIAIPFAKFRRFGLEVPDIQETNDRKSR